MTVETTDNAEQPVGILGLCRAVVERSPVPTAEIDAISKRLRYVNTAFCLLIGKTKTSLVGSHLTSVAASGVDLLGFVNDMERTGEPICRTERVHSSSGPMSWTCTLWPIEGTEAHTEGVILQVTETAEADGNVREMNQALLLGALRQHELIEAAELLNSQLRTEMLARKSAEDALLKSERLAVAGRMAAVLAHEINNPISAVMELLYLVQHTTDVPAEALGYVDQADSELKRIAHIARQTLGFYRDPTEPTTFPVELLLQSIVDLLKAKIRSTGAEVELQCKDGLNVKASHGELRQVFSNLLLNSLEAVRVQGKVRLRAASSTDPASGRARVRITVADNGVGIDAAALHRAFEAFYTTKGSVGNGLGLWVCKQIVKNHGGQFCLRSNTHGPRQGTTISVTLPVAL